MSKISLLALMGCLSVSVANATTFDDVDFNRLKTELVTGLPTGAGVAVTQVEGAVSGAWLPDPTVGQFTGKTFVEQSTGSLGYSAHATSVGKLFFGNTQSTSPNVTNIDLYETNHWLLTGFLHAGEGATLPNITSSRIANHSWVSEGSSAAANVEFLRRVDYVVDVDEYIQVAASNTTPTTTHLLADSFNAIKVSVPVSTGSVTEALNSIYAAGRARADIVAPESTLSGATPRIASAAALLVGHAHSNPTLSSGSTINRNNDTIYYAERSETIKAVLMAGADRNTSGNTNPSTNPLDITDYRIAVANQTSNGLDTRFGAGQLNIYNSYHVLDAGEQNSSEDGGTSIGQLGFDYDPAFGGLSGSNATAIYNFTTGPKPGHKLKVGLVWNLMISSPDVLYDLDLQLVDVTGGVVVVSSTSTIDNTENIWLDLSSNNAYQLKVIRGSGQASFNWDYALAWQISTLPIVTAGQYFYIDENSYPATEIGTVTATVSTGTITKYAIFSGNAGNVFAISDSGVLTVAGAIDYETTASYSLGIVATDGLNVSNTETVVVNVNDINDAPVVIALQALNVDENSPVGANVGTVAAGDVDNAITGFAIVGGSTDFAIDNSGLITVAGALDYETMPSYTLSITATDGINTSGAVDVVINVNNLDEVAPTVAAAQSFSIDENSANGTLVDTVVATDATDAGGVVSGFNIVSGNTGNVFAIASNGAITVAGAVDYEATPSYTLSIIATDGVNTSVSVDVLISVNDLNDVAPTVAASQTLNVDENSPVGAGVGAVVADDMDSVITGFAIVGGSKVFAIDSSGFITVAGALDYETTPSYTLSITATDDTNTSVAVDVVININNLDEIAPVVGSSQSFNVDENVVNATVMGTVAATDAQGVVSGFNIVSGNTGNVFAIASNGILTVVGIVDYETTASYTLGITASDGVNTSAPVNVVVTVNDIVESSASASSSGGGSLGLMWLFLPFFMIVGRRRVS